MDPKCLSVVKVTTINICVKWVTEPKGYLGKNALEDHSPLKGDVEGVDPYNIPLQPLNSPAYFSAFNW